MIQSTQKIIKIGSSGGVTIPAKELKRQNINFGDEVEVIVRPLNSINPNDQEVIDAAKGILNKYRSDFDNLSKR
ncbi:MAG: AbrB/MazE/SpoVT family DNA-binding domain-containing protein [Chryseobacterium sp.]|jgi:antitoxin component of MazEF toxin-antitoxin module